MWNTAFEMPVTNRILGELSSERLLIHTQSIARWVRLSGTPEEKLAFAYVKKELDRFALETRYVEHDAYVSLPRDASLQGLSPNETSVECITHSMAVSTPPGGLESEVIYVGTGSPEDIAKVSLVGRIALADGLATPAKVKALEAAGAIAQIHINGEHVHEMIVSTVWGSPTPEDTYALPRTSIISVSGRDGQRLKRDALRGQLVVHMRTHVDTRWVKIPLLEARLSSEISQDFVMLSGHLDSWHHGAMDNSSANAAMIEIARVLAPHRGQMQRSLRLLFWSGHSHGRYAGSAWYADNHWEELQEHCVVHVNVDSLGGKGATDLVHAAVMAETKALAADAVKRVTGQVLEGSRCRRAGDQSFWGAGVPSVFITLSEQPLGAVGSEDGFGQLMGGKAKTGGLGWWWHTPHDTIDKVDPGLLLRDTRVYATVVSEFVMAPLLPLDYAATALEIRQALEELGSIAPSSFELTVALDRARALERATERLTERMSEFRSRPHSANISSTDDAADLNKCMRKLGRLLIPLNYTTVGPFDQDPAMTVPPVPVLDGIRELAQLDQSTDDARRLLTRLVRHRNYVQNTLKHAVSTIEKSLENRREPRCP